MSFAEQARTALVAHYTRKGLTGAKLNEAVERTMAVQFKPIHARELGGVYDNDKVRAALDKVRALHDEVSSLNAQADALYDEAVALRTEAKAKVREAESILREFEPREAA